MGRGEEQEEFWALRDVSFEVGRGEVLGVVGRNGAGKSTLLKVLSRIMDPTSGEAWVHGRVGSLLEVGTGFHPELTGRENIMLSGALLGMRRSEVRTRFDEIVAFAGVEQFLDTPCKHYSSGMFTRLGFAVAAHLDAEILLIDEVLAVGDAEFQRKCLGKMDAVAKSGRTILFVSHNMAAIGGMCSRALLLERGGVRACGPAQAVVEQYLAGADRSDDVPIHERRDRGGDGSNRLRGCEVVSFSDGRAQGCLRVGMSVRFVFEAEQTMDRVIFAIYGKAGELIVDFDSNQMTHRTERVFPRSRISCTIERLFLLPGRYSVNVAIFSNGRMTDHVERAVSLVVSENEIQGISVTGANRGLVMLPHGWGGD